MTELVTERLELRRWREADLDAYAAIVAEPRVTRFLGGPRSWDAAWRELALFVVAARGMARTGGRVGAGVGQLGQGYASELGRAVRDHVFTVLGAPHLLSVIHPENLASIHVAQAIGARFEREQHVDGARCVIYGQRAHRRSG